MNEISFFSTVIDLDRETLELAGILKAEKRKTVKDFGLVDAIILATGKKYNLRVITTDRHFFGFPWSACFTGIRKPSFHKRNLGIHNRDFFCKACFCTELPCACFIASAFNSNNCKRFLRPDSSCSSEFFHCKAGKNPCLEGNNRAPGNCNSSNNCRAIFGNFYQHYFRLSNQASLICNLAINIYLAKAFFY